jgi:hypothetical protein
MELQVPFAINSDIETWVKTIHPDCLIKSVKAKYSEHPRLHIERMVAEQFVLDKIIDRLGDKAWILDIGGSVTRHAALGRTNVWSACPELTSQDVNRNARNPLGSWCKHLAQNCNCIPYQALISVHSIYYLSLPTIFRLLSRVQIGNFFVVCHEFHGMSGNYNNESTWFRDYDGKIRMSVQGCNFGYCHENVDWLVNGGVFDFRYGQIISTKVQSFGSTTVYSLMLYPGHIQNDDAMLAMSQPWNVAIKNRDASGATIIDGVAVPTVLLNNMLTAAAINYSKSEREITALLYTTFSVDSKKYDNNITVDNYLHTMYTTVKFVQNFNKVCIEHTNSRKRFRFLLIWLKILLYHLCWPFRRFQYRRPKYCDIGVVYNDNFRQPFNNTVFDGQSCDALPIITNYSVIAQAKPRYVERISKVYAYCNHPNVEVPVVFSQTDENIYKSLNDRAFMDVLPIDDSLFEEFVTFIKNDTKVLFGCKKKTVPFLDKSIFDKWNVRFPSNKARRHNDVFVQVSTDGIRDVDITKRRCFLKQEVSFNAANAPRLISGVTDALKVTLGPTIWTLSARASAQLDGLAGVVYAPGRTMKEMGSFYDPDQPSECTDMSRFDARVTERHMIAMLPVYRHLGGSTEFMNILEKSIKSRCYFDSGLIVEPLVSRRSSGHPNTTFENTLLNIFLHRFAHMKAYPEATSLRIMAGGDDVIMQGCDGQKYVDYIKMLGFKVEANTKAPKEGEFYSGLFLPTTSGIILTPKIGRFLQKFGLTTVMQGKPKDWLLGIAKADLYVFSHVDFMANLFLKVIHSAQHAVPFNDPNHLYNYLGGGYTGNSDTLTRICEHYGVTVGELASISDHYGRDENGGYTNHVVAKMIEVDEQ